MSGSEHPSRAGRFTALTTLAVSGALFASALFGISSIDPAADAAGPLAPVPATKSISLEPRSAERDGDCPWRDKDAGGERPSGSSTS